jgi:hypothetical protein
MADIRSDNDNGIAQTQTQTQTQSDTPRQEKSAQVESNGPDGQRTIVDVDQMNEADARLAAQFGYQPVFKREFGYLSTFSFAVSISGLFATIMTTFSYPLTAGGSAAAIWCWLISGLGCMCIAVSDSPPLYIRSERAREGFLVDAVHSAPLPNWSRHIQRREACMTNPSLFLLLEHRG